MERLSQNEIEFATRCLKATRKLHNLLIRAADDHKPLLRRAARTLDTSFSCASISESSSSGVRVSSSCFRFVLNDLFFDWACCLAEMMDIRHCPRLKSTHPDNSQICYNVP